MVCGWAHVYNFDSKFDQLNWWLFFMMGMSFWLACTYLLLWMCGWFAMLYIGYFVVRNSDWFGCFWVYTYKSPFVRIGFEQNIGLRFWYSNIYLFYLLLRYRPYNYVGLGLTQYAQIYLSIIYLCCARQGRTIQNCSKFEVWQMIMYGSRDALVHDWLGVFPLEASFPDHSCFGIVYAT